ncbi:putative phosphorylase [Patellaria atrata CBS 101060]|uniref:Phosphorylase n=1 Tax=Patellaria atrata CBS 101060 TaxID=1346257 RepID=A0A9P4S4X0_9PEZI|nr:putative phosphorylase [Patellaria atrata CBS 101060]
MVLTVDYDSILLKFDSLAAQGVINYSPPNILHLVDGGYPFEFRISHSLLGKPQAEEELKSPEKTLPDAVDSRPVCFGPGSDIANSHPDLLITTVRDTHLLVINKFPLFRPHLLLLTADSYRRQHEPLSLQDIDAAWTVLNSLKSPHYAMFNCTVVAGASRDHKHLHIIPMPDPKSGFCFFPDTDQVKPENVPFRYSLKYFSEQHSEKTITASDLFEVYEGLLKQTRELLGLLDENPICSHNVMLTKEWIISIPRRNIQYHGATANTAGMMGSVWLMKETQLDHLKELGPSIMLSQLGLAARAEE